MKRACLLTAAAAASLPIATDAFGSSSLSSRVAGRGGPVGPLHASTSPPLGDVREAVCKSKRRGGEIVMSSTIDTMAKNAQTIPLRSSYSPVASTLVPSTSFLSRRPRPMSIPSSDLSKYGGRASGTHEEECRNRIDSSSESGGTAVAARSQRSGWTALGFVVDDVDGIGSSTRLSFSASSQSRGHSSSSSPDRVDGSLLGGIGGSKKNGTSGGIGGGRKSRSSSSVDGVGSSNGDTDAIIRPVHSGTVSPIKKRVAASLTLLRNAPPSTVAPYGNDVGVGDGIDSSEPGKATESGGKGGGGGGGTTDERRRCVVPAWFPWIPTRAQIEALKVTELREACVERGLGKTGRKEELQHRLLDWTNEQHRRRVGDRRNSGRLLSSGILGSSGGAAAPGAGGRDRTPLDDMIDRALDIEPGDVSSSSSSIGEIGPLINRRKALRRSKDAKSSGGRKDGRGPGKARGLKDDDETDIDDDDLDDSDGVMSEVTDATPPGLLKEEYLSSLAEAFNSQRSKFSNYEVKQMYQAAKHADQAGDRALSKKILAELMEVTPDDSRIVRRLARMEVEVGNVSGARRVLQNGIRRNPGDAHLLHGLATLELKSGDADAARGLLKEAIRADPQFPNPYHALGTLEHSRGNIRVATTVLRHGLKSCPTNHRLHHALGDLYREARMLDLAELAYRKALEYSPEWGRPFAYTALAYLAYEKGDGSECRRWLQEGLEVNAGMHSQGWLALAQLEESEGRIVAARSVYNDALKRYEKKRIQRSLALRSAGTGRSSNRGRASAVASGEDATDSVQGNKSIASRPSRSGDKWIFVYKSWTRMEEHHGTYESADAVYARATRAYPNNSALSLGWAQLQAKHGHHERARSLFEAACSKAGSRSADPYRMYAEFEMSLQNYSRARSILYLGAQALSESSDGGAGKSDNFAHLFHTWAVCEWHLSNLDRAEVLFDHALRLTDAGKKGSEIRSLILYSIARFLFDARREYVLAQHCVCLSLKENVMPGGNSQIWHLWSEIAKSLENENLAGLCKGQAETLGKEEDAGAGTDLSRLLGLRRAAAATSADSSSSSLPMMTGPAMQRMLKKEPWHHKIAGASSSNSSWYDGVAFPELSVSEVTEGE